MKNKYIFVLVMLLGILILCGGLTTVYVKNNPQEASKDELTIVTSFYPMYIATLNIVDGVEGVELENLSEPQTGCLHDFQLTPEDMKLLSGADVFVINGGGIESFMADVAAAYPKLSIVEACEGLPLLTDEEDGEEVNAHAWMSVKLYRNQVAAIAKRLQELDGAHSQQYEANLLAYDKKLAELQERQSQITAPESNVILFHEAYDYVASDYGLKPVFLMDLDEERQVSAGEVADVVSHIEEYGVKFILAEELYGRDMGDTVQKETQVKVLYINPLNRGDYNKDSYITGMQSNIDILENAFSGKE